jgi:hypothetical protein
VSISGDFKPDFSSPDITEVEKCFEDGARGLLPEPAMFGGGPLDCELAELESLEEAFARNRD